MTWIRLDNTFPEHPKVVSAGPIAALIHIRAICYCSRNLTDGFLPAAAVSSLLTGFEHVGISTGGVPGLCEVGADVLELDWPWIMVKHHLWEPVPGGFSVHDFLDYNPSRKEVVAQRRSQSLKGRKGGQVSAAKRKAAQASGLRSASSKTQARYGTEVLEQEQLSTREEVLTPRARATRGPDKDSVSGNGSQPSGEGKAPLGPAVAEEMQRLKNRVAARVFGEPGKPSAARRASTSPAKPATVPPATQDAVGEKEPRP
jgi:hypothetical protein